MRGRRHKSGGARCQLLLLVMVLAAWGEALVVRCPQASSQKPIPPPYCTCSSLFNILSIKCDFQNKEAVKLTRELMEPFLNNSLKSTYVRIKSAISVYVTSQFMQAWHEVPSFAFDVWHGGNVTLEPTPASATPTSLTFAGVGIVGCNIIEVPAKFIRDRKRGALRIKGSTVGVIRTGVIHNVEQMRYIVLENSVVGQVEGSIASEGYVTLSQRNVHSWNGLIINNTNIGIMAPGAFNITHHSDMESVEMLDCQVGLVGSRALAMAGDISVNIKRNVFNKLERQALKVEVTGTVNFDRNTIKSWDGDALEGFMCHNRTSLESNTFLIAGGVDAIINQSTTPFHTSCGNPQIFLVITPQHPMTLIIDTRGAWALGGVLVVVVVIMVAIGSGYFRRSNPGYNINSGRFTSLLTGRGNRRMSLENLPRHVELNIPSGYYDKVEEEEVAENVKYEDPDVVTPSTPHEADPS